jgi:hypothetical protein
METIPRLRLVSVLGREGEQVPIEPTGRSVLGHIQQLLRKNVNVILVKAFIVIMLSKTQSGC